MGAASFPSVLSSVSALRPTYTFISSASLLFPAETVKVQCNKIKLPATRTRVALGMHGQGTVAHFWPFICLAARVRALIKAEILGGRAGPRRRPEMVRDGADVSRDQPTRPLRLDYLKAPTARSPCIHKTSPSFRFTSTARSRRTIT